MAFPPRPVQQPQPVQPPQAAAPSFQAPRPVGGQPIAAQGGASAKGGMAPGMTPATPIPHPVSPMLGHIPMVSSAMAYHPAPDQPGVVTGKG